MARQDNPFALLGEDEDGGDVSVLLAKVEAKMSSAPAPSPPIEQPKAKSKAKSAPAEGNEFPSKPLPPSDYVRAERGRGRGGRGRGPGRGGYGSAGDDGSTGREDSGRQFGSRYPREFGGDSEGRGRGGGRGGRGRGRGRGFYEDRGFNQENQFDLVGKENREQNSDGVEDKVEVHGRSYEPRSDRGGECEARKYFDGDRRSGREERGNAGEYPRFRGSGEGREGRGAFGGGRGSRGGDGRRYVRRDVARDAGSGGSTGPQEKEAAADGKEQAEVISVTVADVATGWDAPETTEVSKVTDPAQLDAKQASGEALEGKPAEEEDNEMTLEEYEKVLQEKRKALESLRTEERKVIIDKDFQSMQLIEKKEEDNYVKLKLEKDKLKKKDSFEKEEKGRKSVSINEFLKPAEGEKYTSPMTGGRAGGRGRGRGERGGYMAHGGRPDPVFQLQDNQFPELGAAIKA